MCPDEWEPQSSNQAGLHGGGGGAGAGAAGSSGGKPRLWVGVPMVRAECGSGLGWAGGRADYLWMSKFVYVCAVMSRSSVKLAWLIRDLGEPLVLSQAFLRVGQTQADEADRGP